MAKIIHEFSANGDRNLLAVMPLVWRRKIMRKICLFDSNGTLFDINALEPFFAEVFGNTLYLKIWFKTVLHTSLTLSLTREYREFSKISEETFISMARQQGVTVTAKQKTDFATLMQELPAFADIEAGIGLLYNAGYRLAIFTNASKTTTDGQLARTSFGRYFEQIISTDSARVFKPADISYKHAADELQEAPENIWMIAAHAWDTAGAMNVGFRGGLIKREDHGQNDLYPSPDAEEFTLVELAKKIIASDRSKLQRFWHPLRLKMRKLLRRV